MPVSADPQSTPLTTRVRALYENSVAPVREIARLAGVSERTLYKYVAKGGWRRRNVCLARESAAATANRGRRTTPAPGFAPVKGSGGRFIARAQAELPQAHGLKALDPDGAQEAEARCAHAAMLADAAAAEAMRNAQARAARTKAEQEAHTQVRAFDLLMSALVELATWQRDAAPVRSRDAQRLAAALERAIFSAMERLTRS
jgi:hypothetical protein